MSEDNIIIKPKECPFCKSSKIEIDLEDDLLFCEGCHVMFSYWGTGINELIKKFNKRG